MPSPFTRKFRELLPGQRSELTLINADGTGREVIFVADEIIEAPNWHPDGYLVFNAGGEIWRINADGSGLKRIETGTIRDLNNDHVISPDGRTIYLSNSGDFALYAVGIEGGTPRKVSNDHAGEYKFMHFLHGISPDGKTLSYVGIEGPEGQRRINLFTIPAAGGPDTRLSDVSYPNDGPEYSPDGQWIYFSSERNATQPGHAQCYRMRPDGTGIEQLTHDERVNWFPHPSPDGQLYAYISYPQGTLGHPADKAVRIMLMPPDGSWHKQLDAFNGGQGTINVNSWSPDSQRFAYVTYPITT
ncbi:MAG: biopolymer transporter Tol [Hyphomicrobiales bacterium]|nr:MAG: biopolymer transporter Tol [Hyphomicrobiales bacterium]